MMPADKRIVELQQALKRTRELIEQERAARRAAEESAKLAWRLVGWGGAQRQGYSQP